MYQQPQSPPEPAPRKPVSVRLIQILVPVIALCTLALPYFFLQMTVDVIEKNRVVKEDLGFPGLEDLDLTQTPLEYAINESPVEFASFMSLVALALIMAPIAAIGLHKRRRWARVLTAVWAGIVVLPFGFWGVWAYASKNFRDDVTLVEDYYFGPIDAITFNIGAAAVAFVSTLLVFILALTRGPRRWTAKQAAAPTGFQAPGAPPQFGGPQGFAPVQQAAQQYPAQQGGFPQQQQFPQGSHPQQQQFPPQQQPPHGGGY